MLQNNGAFAPNEAPVNMSASVNTPQLGVPILAHNFTNISKNPQENSLSAASSYEANNYAIYGNQGHGLGSEILPYTPFQNFNFGDVQSAQNFENFPGNSIHKLQNFLMNDPDIHSSNAMNFSNVYSKEMIPNSSDLKPLVVDKNELINSPQIKTKAFHKQLGINVQNQINFNDNLPFYSEEFRNSRPRSVFPTCQVIKHETQSNTSKEDPKDSSNSQKSDVEEKSQVSISQTNNLKLADSTISKSQTNTSNSSYKETSNSKSQVQVRIENKPLVNSLRKDLKIVTKLRSDLNVDNPFIRDSNGVKDEAIVKESVERALSDVKNDASHTNYKCETCNLLFSHPKRFLIHHKWHTFAGGAKNGKVKVKTEEKVKKSEDDVKIEGDETSIYECKDCEKIYPTKGKLKHHRFRHHSTTRQCTICEINLPNWRALKAHTETKHMSGDTYKCDKCNKDFKHKHTLARHAKIHNEKTIPCELCSKKFGSELHLKTHMKSHERAEKGHSFHCSFCGRGFHETYHLQVHERSHRNEKPYVCDICSAAYSTNSSLQRHLKVSHNNTSKPYECSFCHRVFKSENIKDRHEIRSHQSEAKLKQCCKECPQKFLKPKDLRRHMYRMHPEAIKRRNKND